MVPLVFGIPQISSYYSKQALGRVRVEGMHLFPGGFRTISGVVENS